MVKDSGKAPKRGGALMDTIAGRDDAVAASAAKRRRRQLNRRSTEEQVARGVEEHCSDMSQLSIHQKLIDGKTFWQEAVALKQKAKERGGKVGKKQWEALKMKYGDAGASLVVKKDSDVVQQALQSAMALARHSNTQKRNQSALLSWMPVANTVNQKEMVGLIRHILGFKVNVGSVGQRLAMEFLKMSARLKLEEAYQAEAMPRSKSKKQ